MQNRPIGSNLLKLFSLIALFSISLSGCFVQTDNSVNGDKQAFSPPSIATTGVSKGFAAANAIFRKNCVPCHAQNYASWSEEQFVTSGKVVAGHPEESEVFERLKGSGVGGTEDMPQSGGALSSADLATIRNWIDGISILQPVPTPSPGASATQSTPTSRTAAALAVIANDCTDCHGDPKTANSMAFAGKVVPAFANFTSDSDFTSSGIVVVGDSQNSWLVRALKSWGDLNLMPTDDDAISADDANALKTWIDNLDPNDPSPVPTPSASVSPSLSPSPSPSPSASIGALNAAGRTEAALAVISNECADCHASAKTASSSAFSGKTIPAFANFTLDSDFLTGGLVLAGDSKDSWLIRAMKGYGDLNLMPTDDGAIPADEAAALTSWIDNIGKP